MKDMGDNTQDDGKASLKPTVTLKIKNGFKGEEKEQNHPECTGTFNHHNSSSTNLMHLHLKERYANCMKECYSPSCASYSLS